MADSEVLIVGAGPTGLVLALWLARLGVACRIIDGNEGPGTTSRAVAVTARTLEFHDQLGIAQAVVNSGVAVPRLNLWVRGSRAARLPIGRMNTGVTRFPFMMVFPQDAHERLLIDQLTAVGMEVERRTALLRFDQRASGVYATLRRGDGSEESCVASYLAGCDGAHSTVREALGTGFPGGTYAEIFYVADVDAGGPATNHEVHIDLDDADFIAVFPMKEQGRVRLIGSVRQPPGGGEHAFTFDDVGQRVIRSMRFRIRKVNWFSTYHVHHRVASKFRDGRAFLLGDAAHIHSPVGGQGMNTGIGDAVNLAWKLAAVLRDRAPDTLLDSYEAERIGFAQRLVATTDRVFTLATAPGRLARFVRVRVVPVVVPWLFGIGAVRRFLFRTVSQVGVSYRGTGDFSAGTAGRIHGGGRLPWVETAPGEHNFAALASLSWQVHIYGDARPGLAEACSALGVELNVFAWRSGMARSGVLRGALYLVRPDGYVALADRTGDPAALRSYGAERGLVFAD